MPLEPQVINIGAAPNDKTGDKLRDGGSKINANFSEVKVAVEALENAGYLTQSQIDTLAELNAIVSDATLIDTTDSRLSDARTPTTHTHVEADITDLGTYVVSGGALGTPTSGTLTNCTGYPTTGLGLTASPLSQFAATTSAQLAGVLSDETGSGAAVFATSPTLVTPALGTPASGTLTNTDGYPDAIVVFLSDETSDLTTGLKATIPYWPYNFTLTDIIGGLATAPTGSSFIGDVHENGVSIMTTNKLLIDATETTTKTASTAPTLTDTSLALGSTVEFYIDQIGSTNSGQGFSITFKGHRT